RHVVRDRMQGPRAAAVVGFSGGVMLTGVTVSVVGTAISVVVDVNGRVTLANVPPGDVNVRLRGAGANATLPLGTVDGSQTVDIVVTGAGSSASLESQVRTGPEA